MMIEPLSDRILVRRISAESQTAGGILIPETAKERPDQGIVVAAGPGKRDADGVLHRPVVQLEDRVLFGKYAGTDIELDGQKHLILREDDILGIVR